MKKLLIPFLLVLGLVGFYNSYAHAADIPADPSTNPADALNQFWAAVTDKRWGIAAVIGTMLFVALVRFVAPKVHGKFGAWINSTRVSCVLAFLSGTLAAMATQLFKGGKFTPQLLVYGFGFGVAAVGGYNSFFDLLFPADKKPAAGTTTSPPVPPITKAAVLLPFVFIVFSFAGCAHLTPSERAFGNSYAACMESKGLAVAPGVGAEAWNDLTKGTNATVIESQLEQLALKAGVDAVGCAVASFLNAPTPSSDGGAKLTAEAPKNPAGVVAGQAFLEKHSRTTSL
jgi:hypothetical protein